MVEDDGEKMRGIIAANYGQGEAYMARGGGCMREGDGIE